MNQTTNTINITIDNQSYRVPAGITILQAAQLNDIYIPTLCAHKDLTPHGGCRMCIVEVEGMRNLPTACTTPIQDGMIVRTNTAQVKSVRMEILQLFLSEHTSSCLVCDEREECKKFSVTIRKTGVSTGCRYCSNDGQCELQDVAETLGVSSINYPIHYRNLRVEKEDPFYDRNYNLCILCGRCVRMCQEIRVANVLAFNYRGRDTVIGPSYERTHLEAGCEFCGACVSVCPTGALTEKARAYEGPPQREVITTCSFCGVGCQMRLEVKGDRIIGSLPADDTVVNNGQLCVKGRFSIPELIHGHKRLKHPYRKFNEMSSEVVWEEAIEAVAEKLTACPPEKFGMMVSPNCSNEDLYVAQKFARVVMKSNNIDTSARLFYGAGFNAYLKLMRRAVPLSEVRKASVVVCVGLDTRFGRSVVGVELRRANNRGAKIVTINPREHNLTLISDTWLRPIPGTELELLAALADLTGKAPGAGRGKAALSDHRDDLERVAQMLHDADKAVILVGSEFLQYDDSAELLAAIDRLAANANAGVLPLPAQNNLFGSLKMGAYAELLPGGVSSGNAERLGVINKKWKVSLEPSSQWNALKAVHGARLEVLYLIGENPPATGAADFIISQNIYPSEPFFEPDIALPSAAFTESDGSFINGEGRLQRVRRAVDPPGDAKPDWMILCEIALRMGAKGFDYTNSAEIHREIGTLVKGFGDLDDVPREAAALELESELEMPKVKRAKAAATDKTLPFVLSTSITEHTHRGFPLTAWVQGTVPLFSQEALDMNPDDARKAKIADGDKVLVSSDGFERVWPVRIVPEQASGTVHVTLCQAEAVNPNPRGVKIRRSHV